MSTPPFPTWKSTESEARFADPSAFAERADSFARQIRLRNLIEYGAGILVIALFGGSAIGAGIAGEWLIALALALVVAGTAVVLRNLHRRASNLERPPEAPCLAHLRAQYARQHAALRAVPAWYIGPLVPGVALFYLAVTIRVAEETGFAAAIKGIVGPAAITFGIFAAIAAANWFAARGLKRKIAQLDALA